MSTQDIIRLLLLISPIILIQLGLVIYALVDLSRRRQVRGPRWAWAVGLIVTAVTVPTGIIVVAFYLIWGRNAEAGDDTD